ncbi:hypothetical protein BCR44DRAFT_1427841 [Catenaria anguillulae PL171]|uniref:Uncharacterized protein n=1 Tax=Catenaria anguillulae PL171 TaxID=765915 RepID=A0A1Y2HW26_9FUNG|nr:hypothetical protein BCR44DRAFT_1427841 [Catenaria anguillulae PL171]
MMHVVGAFKLLRTSDESLPCIDCRQLAFSSAMTEIIELFASGFGGPLSQTVSCGINVCRPSCIRR